MVDHHYIYTNEGFRYQALVAQEDYQRNLLPAIRQICTLEGQTILELGAGTGRLSVLFAPFARCILGTDISYHMLSIGQDLLRSSGFENWDLSLATHTALPFRNGFADLVIAGWSFCYAALNRGENWLLALEAALAEVNRVLHPGGTVILIESQGTGYITPHTPAVLADYLAYLNTCGFESTWIRTDYCFKDRREAEELTRFFFGSEPLPMWETSQGVIVPECTGLWWRSS